MLQTFRDVALVGVGLVAGGLLMIGPSWLRLRDAADHIFFGGTLLMLWLVIEAAYYSFRKDEERRRGDRQ